MLINIYLILIFSQAYFNYDYCKVTFLHQSLWTNFKVAYCISPNREYNISPNLWIEISFFFPRNKSDFNSLIRTTLLKKHYEFFFNRITRGQKDSRKDSKSLEKVPEWRKKRKSGKAVFKWITMVLAIWHMLGKNLLSIIYNCIIFFLWIVVPTIRKIFLKYWKASFREYLKNKWINKWNFICVDSTSTKPRSLTNTLQSLQVQ